MKNLLILVCILGFGAAQAEEIKVITNSTPENCNWSGPSDASKVGWRNTMIWGVYVIEYKGKEYIVNAAGGICPVDFFTKTVINSRGNNNGKTNSDTR